MKNIKQWIILLVPAILIVLGIVILSIMQPDENSDRVFVGLFETTQIRVASEIPGRIDTIYISLGDKVVKGQLLATIESDILDAKIQQAEGVYSAAESVKSKADKGARDEEIVAVKNQYEIAKSQYAFAQ